MIFIKYLVPFLSVNTDAFAKPICTTLYIFLVFIINSIQIIMKKPKHEQINMMYLNKKENNNQRKGVIRRRLVETALEMPIAENEKISS